MKICILTTGHSALDCRVFYKQALSLRKKYDDITLIAPGESGSYLEQGIMIKSVRKAESLFDRLKLGDTIVAKAIESRADIYHFHDYELIFKVLKIKKASPHSKIIYDVHEHYPDMLRMSRKVPKLVRPAATLFVDKAETYFARKFDQIITADDAVKARFDRYNPCVDVIYNFSEFNKEEKGSRKNQCEKEYDVIYQGGITLERGILNDIRAIRILKDKFPGIKMVLVGSFGDAAAKELVERYIKENDLENNIIFAGKVPHLEVEGYIRKSKIGMVTLLPFPKFCKNIPIKQFEYMSCGIPVVGSDLPPIRRFLASHHSGIVVDPTKPDEIARAIDTLLSDPHLCREMGDNGIKAVREEYNWGNMEKKLFEIYRRLEQALA